MGGGELVSEPTPDGGRLSTKFEHAYLPPAQVHALRCEYCVHYFEGQRRCSLIRPEDGDVNPGDCCAFWFNNAILDDEYGTKTTKRTRNMRAPDLGRLLTKAEARFAEDVDQSIEGCADCVFFSAPGTCTLIGRDTVEAGGACARFWRNPTHEAEDDRLHAEFKSPPPEADRSWVERAKAWLSKFLTD